MPKLVFPKAGEKTRAKDNGTAGEAAKALNKVAAAITGSTSSKTFSDKAERTILNEPKNVAKEALRLALITRHDLLTSERKSNPSIESDARGEWSNDVAEKAIRHTDDVATSGALIARTTYGKGIGASRDES